MKRELENLDLRAAFRAEPERCHQALMDAARSVREEKIRMKRFSMRAVLIAALVAMTMLTTAFAAGEIFGWTDYFEDWGIHITPKMQSAMQMEPRNYALGPVNFTVQEAVSDNRFVLVSTKVTTADGSAVLMVQDAYDRIGAFGERSQVLMNALGVEDKTLPCYKVAAQKGLPLYSVRVAIEVEDAVNGGEGMEDVMWDAQGNIICLTNQSLNTANLGEELAVTLFMRVAQLDEKGEEVQKWTTRESFTIPVGQMLAEKHYTPDQAFTSNGAELTCIRAELYATGAYLTVQWKMPDDVVNDDNFNIWTYHTDPLPLTTADGLSFERGVSLSGGYDDSAWPYVKVMDMINVDVLPDALCVGGMTYK